MFDYKLELESMAIHMVMTFPNSAGLCWIHAWINHSKYLHKICQHLLPPPLLCHISFRIVVHYFCTKKNRIAIKNQKNTVWIAKFIRFQVQSFTWHSHPAMTKRNNCHDHLTLNKDVSRFLMTAAVCRMATNCDLTLFYGLILDPWKIDFTYFEGLGHISNLLG